MGAQELINRAKKDLGLGEPNYIQKWYHSRNGIGNYNWPWCNAAVTKWAYDSGNHKAVCFGKDYAYTVAHATEFRRQGRWYEGTESNIRNKMKPGDIVFFDWGGSNSIGSIDHVGIVERVVGSTVYTIEGNIGDRCSRKVRYSGSIAGFGRPAYTPSKPIPPGQYPGHMVEKGDQGDAVKQIQKKLVEKKIAKLEIDGEFGPMTQRAVKAFQKLKKLEVDGVVGPMTWKALFA